MCASPGRLDDAWRSAAEAAAGRLRANASDFDAALGAARDAVRAARALIGAAPPVLRGDVGVDTAAAVDAWTRWAEPPAGDVEPADLRAWAEHLTTNGGRLVDAVDALHAAAGTELTRRAERWAPVAAELADWCRQARRAEVAASVVAGLKAAETWLKAANDQIRNDRLGPFAERTVELWRQLRQESNVELTAVRLAGSATHARVDFDVTVDGDPAAALGVMSQGEVNALALSVFLPRATLPASPFRFLVIDDPVQAMDPSKVDGLARVLAEVASDRQVIVFTHDDRLPDAVRRLGLPARIIEVKRRPGSIVAVHAAGDPCAQLLADARQLTVGDGVPLAVAERVIPGLCRAAIETACLEIARRRRLRAGAPHDEVEAALAAASRTTKKAALAIFDDPDRGGDVLGWLDRSIGSWATTAYQTANKGAHGAATFDADRLVRHTGDLVDRLRAALQP